MWMARQYRLLGRLEIDDNGRPAVVMKYSKGCALLAYLIVSRQSCRREFLADLLWESSSTAQSLRNLRKLLHQIRPLAPELHATREQLSLPAHSEIDVDFFTLEQVLTSQDIVQLAAALPLYIGLGMGKNRLTPATFCGFSLGKGGWD